MDLEQMDFSIRILTKVKNRANFLDISSFVAFSAESFLLKEVSLAICHVCMGNIYLPLMRRSLLSQG